MPRVVARGRSAVAIFVVVLVGAYIVNGWLSSRGIPPLIHGGARGGWEPYAGECTAFGLNLWVPCWLAAGAPLLLVLLAAGVLVGRD
jgi:hypothetical protein